MQNKSPKKIPHYHQKKFQLIYLVIIMLLFFIKAIISLNQFRALEPAPPLFPNLPIKEQQFGRGFETVKVGLNINDVPEFDVLGNKFALEGDLWFEFNPQVVSFETIDSFKFEKASHLEKFPPSTKLIDGRLFVSYPIRVTFSSQLIHKYFPFDDHRIYLELKIDKVAPDEIFFEVSPSSLHMKEGINPLGWTPLSFEAKTGYAKGSLDENDKRKYVSYPEALFKITFLKPGFRKVFVILGPIILLFFLGLLSLLIEGKSDIKVGLAAGSITGLLVYRFVIEALSPNVGYFTPIDYLYLLFISSTFVVLILNVYELSNPVSMRFKSNVFYLVQVFALVVFYTII